MVDVEAGVMTEVPEALKLLVRYVMRGFYGSEHVVVADMLMHHPCIKEDDLLERLNFDRKQLRSVINSLKMDHFVKTRLRVETDAEGKTTKHNYYFVSYNVFVNVVKYKLDNMRRKIDNEERTKANRASFTCTECEKQFSDLEVGQLMEGCTGLLKCTYCHAEVTDDPTGSNAATDVVDEATGNPSSAADKRTLMIKFNEQIERIFSLLREVEKFKLSASILEPEPLELKPLKAPGGHSGGAKGADGKWSDPTRGAGIDLQTRITISTEGEPEAVQAKPRATPLWMTHSTVDGSAVNERTGGASTSQDSSSRSVRDSNSVTGVKPLNAQDVMKTLLSHEKRSAAGPGFSTSVGAGGGSNEASSSSSDSEDEEDSNQRLRNNFGSSAAMFGSTIPGKMDLSHATDRTEDVSSTDEMEEGPLHTVTIGGVRHLYQDITADMVARMSAPEKAEYIRVGQELYQDYYD